MSLPIKCLPRPGSLPAATSVRSLFGLWLLLLLWAAGDTPLAGAVSAALPTGFPAIRLTARMRGEQALSAMGTNVAALAAFYRVPEAELRQRLRTDRSLWVDAQGQLLYVCEWPAPVGTATNGSGTVAASLSAAGYPYEQTFRLHSRPGSSKLIYLDFDGHDGSGTSWGQDAIARPFDIDGDPSTFSNTERDRIQFIWQRVSEDYAMYDVDVTTEEPGTEALRKANGADAYYGIRAVIGGSSSDWYGSAGGVAFVGSFNRNSDTPCWIFPKSLGPDNEKYIAEAVSHEVGHTLGLNHDGADSGGSHTEYYSGQGNWAPLMGVGYYEPISQWSKGEYANANNTQDDLAVMQTYGLNYRPDDHGNAISSATILDGPLLTAAGNIERATDVDFFVIEPGAGRTTITVTPFVRGANLHATLVLYNSAGTVLIATNSTDTSAGVQPVTISTVLAAGKYFFSVEGTGSGNPATDGYSDYASIGQYTISGTLPQDSAWLPTTEGSYAWTTPANWASNTVPMGPGVTARFAKNIAGDQVVRVDSLIALGYLTLGDADGSNPFTFESENGGLLALATATGSAGITKIGNTNDVIVSPLLLNSDLVVTNNSAGTLTLSGELTGGGGLTKAGNGTLVLAGTNTFTGNTLVEAGTLHLAATASLKSALIDLKTNAVLDAVVAGLTVLSNRTVQGGGIVLGETVVQAGGNLVPGGSGSAGTLIFSNGLALATGARLRFDLAAETTPGGGTNDLLWVGGDLSVAAGVKVEVTPLAGPLATPGTYTLIHYAGALTGTVSNWVTAANSGRYVLAFDDSVPGEIRVHVSGAPLSLTWQGDGVSNRWEVLGATNWLATIPEVFAPLDAVIFTDGGSVTPAVNLIGALQPASVTVNAASNYTFSGTGKITGTADLVKAGIGTLGLNTANDFSGVVHINEGRVRVGQGAALGNTDGGTVIATGAQLDLNAVNLGGEVVTVAGDGLGASGALINGSTSAQTNALRFVTLTGDTTVGGVGRWDIRANPTGAFTGNGFDLTKTGTNEIWLAELGSTGLGDIDVQQGALGIEGATTLGNAGNRLVLNPGTTLALTRSDVAVLSKKFFLTNATVRSEAGNNIVGGAMTVTGTNTVNVTAGLSLQGVIGGEGGLTKSGGGILTLSAANTFTGAVAVTAGTLRVKNGASLGTSNGPTIIASGGRLDLNGINLDDEPVIVQGTGLGNAGAIINYGGGQNNALRFVTLAGNATFGGINRWDVRANPTANFAGNNFALTKTGPNEIWLVDVGASGLGNITVNEGLFGVQGNTTLGTDTAALTVNSAALSFWANGTNILNKRLTLNTSKLVNGNGSNTFVGPITLTGSNRVDVAAGTTLVLGESLAGPGAVHAVSAGTLVFADDNSYSGVTVVNAGTLRVGAGGGTGSLGTGNVTNNAAIVFQRTNDFTVANRILGTGTLRKQGSGTLTLSGPNEYVGLTTVESGTLRAGIATSLGTSVNGTLVSDGASLDVNGFRIGTEVITVSGAGVQNAGALINQGAAQSNALRYVTLAGDTVIGGSSRWDVRDPGNGGDSALNGAGYSLTKIANNQVWLANLGNTALGDVFVAGGTLFIQGTTTLGDATKSLIISNSATLALASLASPLNKLLVLSGGNLSSTSGSNVFSGTVTLVGTNQLEVVSGRLTLAGDVAGNVSLRKTGGGQLWLTHSNALTGDVLITAGTLGLEAGGSVTLSPLIDVIAGATFDSTAGGGFILHPGQVLAGNGTVAGDTLALGKITPGASVGRLSFTDSVVLAGELVIETSKTDGPLTNDFLSVGSFLSLGGTLTVTHTGEELAAGDTFQIFSAALVSDDFATLNLPPLGPGLSWDTSDLAESGTLRVTGLTAPMVSSPVWDGTNLVMEISSQAGVTYVLEATPSLEPPVIWTGIVTNAGTGGVLSFSATVDVDEPRKFYRVNAY